MTLPEGIEFRLILTIDPAYVLILLSKILLTLLLRPIFDVPTDLLDRAEFFCYNREFLLQGKMEGSESTHPRYKHTQRLQEPVHVVGIAVFFKLKDEGQRQSLERWVWYIEQKGTQGFRQKTDQVKPLEDQSHHLGACISPLQVLFCGLVKRCVHLGD